jgi:hypothetical protein
VAFSGGRDIPDTIEASPCVSYRVVGPNIVEPLQAICPSKSGYDQFGSASRIP